MAAAFFRLYDIAQASKGGFGGRHFQAARTLGPTCICKGRPDSLEICAGRRLDQFEVDIHPSLRLNTRGIGTAGVFQC